MGKLRSNKLVDWFKRFATLPPEPPHKNDKMGGGPTSDKNPSSDRPPNASFSAASKYGAFSQGLAKEFYQTLKTLSV